LRRENASFQRFFLIIRRMTSHETTKNALRPKNHHGFKHACAEEDRRWPIVADQRLTRRNPVQYQIFRAAWERRLTRQVTENRWMAIVIRNIKQSK